MDKEKEQKGITHLPIVLFPNYTSPHHIVGNSSTPSFAGEGKKGKKCPREVGGYEGENVMGEGVPVKHGVYPIAKKKNYFKKKKRGKMVYLITL